MLLISAGRSGIDVEIEPAQTQDVGVARGVPRSCQPVVRPCQQIGSNGVEGHVGRHSAQPAGLVEQSLVIVEPTGERAAAEAAGGSIASDRRGLLDQTPLAGPAARYSPGRGAVSTCRNRASFRRFATVEPRSGSRRRGPALHRSTPVTGLASVEISMAMPCSLTLRRSSVRPRTARSFSSAVFSTCRRRNTLSPQSRPISRYERPKYVSRVCVPRPETGDRGYRPVRVSRRSLLWNLRTAEASRVRRSGGSSRPNRSQMTQASNGLRRRRAAHTIARSSLLTKLSSGKGSSAAVTSARLWQIARSSADFASSSQCKGTPRYCATSSTDGDGEPGSPLEIAPGHAARRPPGDTEGAADATPRSLDQRAVTGQCPDNETANPVRRIGCKPGRVGRRIKVPCRPDQAEIPFLNQVVEGNAALPVIAARRGEPGPGSP